MDTHTLAHKIRFHALRMTHEAKSSHIGSILSIADIVAVLYGGVLKKDPANPRWDKRDRFILSKGHACGGVYAALAETGFFPVDRLQTYCCNGGLLAGHISHIGVSGVELSTGSLGHGLPVGVGMAFAAQLDAKAHRVFVLLSDGECDEGTTWEAALFASHHMLSNLVAIIDYNKLQSLGLVADTLGLEPLCKKWRAFGWKVVEIDGHDHESLAASLNVNPQHQNNPTCLIAHTVKGKGISFMEHSVLWHYRSPQGEEYQRALEELGVHADEK